jgi:hypothetical protein
MPTAKEVAIELRKLADSLEVGGETMVDRAYVYFAPSTKEEFLATARLMPRPLGKKEDSYGDSRYHKIYVEHKSPAMHVSVSVLKSLTCELVEPARPAVYRCAPILSEEEDLVLGEEVRL